MKTAKQWIDSYERGDSPNEREINEIQEDAMRAGLEVAVEYLTNFWGHGIVRDIARELCRKNGLPVPEIPFDPRRNPPTPSEVPPPKTLENWGKAPRTEPGYPPPMTEPGPLFPSQQPAPASPPPKDCSADPKPLEPTPEPTSLNPWEESVVNFLGRHQKRLDVLEEAAKRLTVSSLPGSAALFQRIRYLESQMKLVPLPKGCQRVPEAERYLPAEERIEAPPGDYEGQQVNAVLKWTGGQWLLLQSHPR